MPSEGLTQSRLRRYLRAVWWRWSGCRSGIMQGTSDIYVLCTASFRDLDSIGAARTIRSGRLFSGFFVTDGARVGTSKEPDLNFRPAMSPY